MDLMHGSFSASLNIVFLMYYEYNLTKFLYYDYNLTKFIVYSNGHHDHNLTSSLQRFILMASFLKYFTAISIAKLNVIFIGASKSCWNSSWSIIA